MKRSRPAQQQLLQHRVKVEMVKVLGSLPVIHKFCRRLQISEIVDRLCPKRDLEDVLTHGQVVEALIANRLTSPLPLYEIEGWAEVFAVEEVFGIRPKQLNDDCLGAALDALAPQVEGMRGSVGLQAISEFGLDARKLHWDLSDLIFEGDYEHQKEDFPQVQLAYSSNRGTFHKQVRFGLATTQDGAIPVWNEILSGSKSDSKTVVSTMNHLKKHLKVDRFLLIGDAKLSSQDNLLAVDDAGNRFLAPLASNPALDREFLSLLSQDWEWINYTSERDRKKPLEEQIQYVGREVEWIAADSQRVRTGPQSKRPRCWRKLFISSSEERETCRTYRARKMEKVRKEIEHLKSSMVKSRHYTKPEKVIAKVEKILSTHKASPYFTYEVLCEEGKLVLQFQLDEPALRAAEALDGYYVLVTNVPPEEATLTHLFTDYKRQAPTVERRFSDGKGPLRIRPVFLKNNPRIVALVTVVLVALMIFCLIEREVRRQLKETDGFMRGLLPENRKGRATGRKILWALRTLTVVVTIVDEQRYAVPTRPNAVQQELLDMLGVALPVNGFG